MIDVLTHVITQQSFQPELLGAILMKQRRPCATIEGTAPLKYPEPVHVELGPLHNSNISQLRYGPEQHDVPVFNHSLSLELGNVSKRTSNRRANSRSGARKRNEQSGAHEWAVRTNGRASGLVLTSGFLVVLEHSATTTNTSPPYSYLTMKELFCLALPDKMVAELGLVGEHAAALRAAHALLLRVHAHVLFHVTTTLNLFRAFWKDKT